MSDSNKLWVIDLGDELETSNPGSEQQATVPPPAVPRQQPIRAKTAPVQSAPTPRKMQRAAGRKPMHIALLLALTYALGPFAILLTEQGRKSKPWLATGIASGALAIILVSMRGAILASTQTGRGLIPLFVFSALVFLGCFSVWARALLITGDAVLRRGKKLPSWVKTPWAAGGLSFVVPGFGLLITGCPKRAAAVVWSCWPALLSALMLGHAGWIWSVQQRTGHVVATAEILELVFLVTAIVAAVSVLGLTAQALEGARQAFPRSARIHNQRGDWYALALLGSVACLVVASDPTSVASRLDHHSESLHASGLRVIPLYMTLAASRLDPADSQYVLQAIDLNTELGRIDEAAGLRARLDEDLSAYVQVVMGEGETPLNVDTAPVEAQSLDPAAVGAEAPVFYGAMLPVNMKEQSTDARAGALAE